MATKVKITYSVESSDHDGYCTGEECSYEASTEEVVVDAPKNILGVDWASLIPVEKHTRAPVRMKSGWCRLSKESIEAGLDYHDLRITLLSVEVMMEEEADDEQNV